jgi:uncharacterized membrane protein YccC
VYFLFMVLAGALWHPSEWQGWVLMLVFIVSRLGSRSGLLRKCAARWYRRI